MIMSVKIQTSIADVFDRLSILEIKEEKIQDKVKLTHISKEKHVILDELKKYRNETDKYENHFSEKPGK